MSELPEEGAEADKRASNPSDARTPVSPPVGGVPVVSRSRAAELKRWKAPMTFTSWYGQYDFGSDAPRNSG